ncbi:unnamed protein product [Prunus armeniaca]
MSQASASHTQSRRSLPSRLNLRTSVRDRLGPRPDIHARLGPQGNGHERLGSQGGQTDNHCNWDREERRSTACSQRNIHERLDSQGGQLDNPYNEDHEERRSATKNPSQAQSTNEEVTQSRPNRKAHRRDRPAIKFEDALRVEVDRANFSPFTAEIEQAAPQKRFSTPSFTCFKGDSDPESHLKHFKSLMILYKAKDALMCKVSFKELTYVCTKEYTSYRTIKKNPDHLFNMRKKPDESLRDYIKRFKAEKANIVGCDDQIASSAFKKCLLVEHDLYRELTITPSQTLAEVFSTTERYMLWDDDRIAAKKSTEQEDRPTKRVDQKSDRLGSKDNASRTHKEMLPPPLKGDPDKRDTRKYCAFHATHGHNTNNYFAWKAHLEELVREGHCTEFITKQAIQQIEDRETTKEPPQKVMRINIILAESEESGLTNKEKTRKIKQAIMISQVSTSLPLAEDNLVIGFQKKDLISLDLPHNDALVISIQIAQAMVDRIHVDEGSAANIQQLAVIQQMGLETKINKSAKSLTGFNGTTTVTVGTIDLDVYSPTVISSQTFMVIDEVSPYNGILCRPWIAKINAITSATHQKIRYPIPGVGIGQINSDQAMVRKCSVQGLKKGKQT